MATATSAMKILWESLWSWWVWLYTVIRGVIKWFIRAGTRLGEVHRACYGLTGAQRTVAVEASLRRSRNPELRQLVVALDEASDRGVLPEAAAPAATSLFLRVKKINPKVHPNFPRLFECCVRQIWGYRQLLWEIENLRTTQYDSDLFEHEEKLYRLWEILMPHEPLDGRITKQWQDIGFQGDDPKTDFRGMGMLGLENLLFFAKEYTGACAHVLSHSHHPRYGYTFAIVGINLTAMAYNLFKDGSVRTHVFNVCKKIPDIATFHHVYSYLFYKFDKFWIESKPQNMMEFSEIQRKFEKSIRAELSDRLVVFRLNFATDTI